MAFVNWFKKLAMSTITTEANPTFRRSATVIVLEPASERILVCVRGSQASFMPGALVFPGGLVEPADEKFPLDRLSNLRSHRNVTGDQLSTRVCGARELFEECGILPLDKERVEKSRRSKWLSAAEDSSLADWQSKVQVDPMAFHQLYGPDSPSGANFDAIAMFPFARWVTPVTFTQRYDTEFLIMLADRCALTNACSKELERIEWLRPAEIIMKSIKGELQLPPPQIYEINRLQSIDFEDDNFSRFAGYDPVCPQLIDIGDRMIAVLPGDHMYITAKAETVPVRKMTREESGYGSSSTVLHRMEFAKKPMWSNWKITYQNCQDRPVDL